MKKTFLNRSLLLTTALLWSLALTLLVPPTRAQDIPGTDVEAATTSAPGVVQLATNDNARFGDSSTAVVSAATARELQRSKGLERWFRNVASRVAAGETVNVIGGIDSLTAGASGGYSWLQPLRNALQNALGDGGGGYQPTTTNGEFGVSGYSYSGWTPWTRALTDAPTGHQIYSIGVETLIDADGGNSFTAPITTSAIGREHTDVDLYYLKTPGGTSFRGISFLSGPIYAGISSNAVDPTIGKLTLSSLGRAGNDVAQNVVIDQVVGELTLLGLNMRRGTGGARVHRWAVGGMKTSQMADLDNDSQVYYFGELGTDLVILNAGMNDRATSTKAEFKADVETIITRVRTANTNAAILLWAPNNVSPADPVLDQFRAAMIELAGTYDCAFVDGRWMLGTNDEAYARGLMSVDRVHPTELGFRMQAAWLYEFIGGGYLSQKKPTVNGDRAPSRDVNAVSVGNVMPLSASKTWDPESLADGATATTTLTVTGAKTGRPVIASLGSLTTQNLELRAQVSANDTVSFWLKNVSGGTVDISSGTLRAVVWMP